MGGVVICQIDRDEEVKIREDNVKSEALRGVDRVRTSRGRR